MTTITRSHDNATFVIPDYRELLSAKKRSLLRKEILLLSQNYGPFVYIRRKNNNQYEATFAQEEGFLLGETVWAYFNKPLDLIYCELLPQQTEALLVVVKSGSVHIDIQIPLENIAEELAVFKNQPNNFEIYVYGDVPISDAPLDESFSFDKNSVKSFTELDQSLFENLPVNPNLKLIPVNDALKKQGIGPFPLKPLGIGLIALIIIWYGWGHTRTSYKKVLPNIIVGVVDPYARFINTLESPSPAQEIKQLVSYVDMVSSAPGWDIISANYSSAKGFSANLMSDGGTVDSLQRWSFLSHVNMTISDKGVIASLPNITPPRKIPKNIYTLQSVVSNLIDKVNIILPGNNIKLEAATEYSQYKEMKLTIMFADISSQTLLMLGNQFKDLPLVLRDSTLTVGDDGAVSGQLLLTALGN